MRRVVITGIGMLSPLGKNLETSWSGALSGKSGIGVISQFDASLFASQIAGEVSDFDVADYMSPKEARKMGRFIQLAVVAAEQAWADSGLKEDSFDATRAGSIMGVGIGGLDTLEHYYGAYLESGPRKISPFLIPAMISNLAPGHIGIKYGLKGVNFAITSACTSSTHAIGESYRMIANGVQDLIFTGGSESAVTPSSIGGFSSMKALSTRNEAPEKGSRPFDKDRDGFVLSEGGVVLVLESLESAEKRNAKIYAEVKGYGFSCDAGHITAPSSDGAGAMSCMELALENANLKREDIQYVNAHGTSTPLGDVAETVAIKNVYGDWAKSGLLVSSTKSMTGHLLGAAGAIEAGFCAMAIKDGVVPPTINLDNPSEECDLDYVANKARKVELTNVMSNSFGFGGTNASVILSKVE